MVPCSGLVFAEDTSPVLSFSFLSSNHPLCTIEEIIVSLSSLALKNALFFVVFFPWPPYTAVVFPCGCSFALVVVFEKLVSCRSM